MVPLRQCASLQRRRVVFFSRRSVSFMSTRSESPVFVSVLHRKTRNKSPCVPSVTRAKLKCIPKSTDRVRAQLCPDCAAATAASLTLYKLLLVLASLFQEPKTWLPISFRTRHYISGGGKLVGVGSKAAKRRHIDLYNLPVSEGQERPKLKKVLLSNRSRSDILALK